MLELWQAEWCPFSHRVRMRLTELGLSYVAHPVPVDREARRALYEATGAASIPTLVDGGTVVHGADEIIAYLGRPQDEPEALRHRSKLEEEWPHWLEQHGVAP